MLTLKNSVTLDGEKTKLRPREGSCNLQDIIYVAVCDICSDFYIGHTIDKLRIRINGHRSSFKPGLYKKSALAFHIFTDHNENISLGLDNFSIGVIKQLDPRYLLGAENLLIIKFEADSQHLNRYKAVRYTD